MCRRLLASSLLGLVAGLCPAPAEASSAYSQVLKVYERRGQIAPCLFTNQELQSALKGIDTYAAQYFQDFPSAIQAALAARNSGACLSPSSRKASSVIRGRLPPQRLRPLTAPSTGAVPAPLLLLALLAVVVGGLAIIAAAIWWLGLEPRGLRWCRQLWAEVGLRARETWLDFGERRRSGSG